MMLSKHPLTYRLLLALCIPLGFLAGGSFRDEEPVRTDSVHGYDQSTIYPGTGKPEKFCVRDFTGPDGLGTPAFDQGAVQTQVYGWLVDPSGWEGISTADIDFQSVYCDNSTQLGQPGDANFRPPGACRSTLNIQTRMVSSPPQPIGTTGGCQANIFIDFLSDPPPGKVNVPCPPPDGGESGGCAPIHWPNFDNDGNTDGHTHWRRSEITMNFHSWQAWSPAEKRRALLHEMGHVLGLGHKGPLLGITNTVGHHFIGSWDVNPRSEELVQARLHLRGDASIAVAPCVGWPRVDLLDYGWIDSAWDETGNEVSLQRYVNGVWNDIPAGSVTKAAQPGGGNRVWFSFDPTTANSGQWRIEAFVHGGPDGTGGPVFAPNVQSPAVTADGIKPPCLVRAGTLNETTSAFRVQVQWRDSTYNESQWRVYVARLNMGGGFLSNINNNPNDDTWTLATTKSAHSGPGYQSVTLTYPANASPDIFDADDWLCYKVTTVGTGGTASATSNITCTVLCSTCPAGYVDGALPPDDP